MEQTDQDLVFQVRSGDNNAFRSLVERWSRRVYRLAYRMTGQAQDAEDVVQETFYRAYRQLERFESKASFGTWIFRIAVNCSVDLLRVRKRHVDGEDLPEQHSREMPPDRLAESSELRQKFERSLRLLTQQERSAFLLRHYEGCSIEQISLVMELSETAVKNSIFRAVQKLRRQLEPLCMPAKSN